MGCGCTILWWCCTQRINQVEQTMIPNQINKRGGGKISLYSRFPLSRGQCAVHVFLYHWLFQSAIIFFPFFDSLIFHGFINLFVPISRKLWSRNEIQVRIRVAVDDDALIPDQMDPLEDSSCWDFLDYSLFVDGDNIINPSLDPLWPPSDSRQYFNTNYCIALLPLLFFDFVLFLTTLCFTCLIERSISRI